MRLIDADALYEEIDNIGGCGAKPHTWEAGWDDAITAVLEILKKAPMLPPEAVNHARWKCVAKPILIRECSQCSTQHATGTQSAYCSNCGAKMDGGTDNG